MALPSEVQVEEAEAVALPSEVQVEEAEAVALPSEAQVERAAEHPPEPQLPGRQAGPVHRVDAGPADHRHHAGGRHGLRLDRHLGRRRGPLPDRRRDLLLDYRRVLHRGAVDPLSSAPAEAVLRPAGLSLVDPSPFHPVVLA